MGIIKQCTHPHPPKVMPHTPPPAQNNAPPTKKQHTVTQNNPSLTTTHTKYDPITHIYSNFSSIMR